MSTKTVDEKLAFIEGLQLTPVDPDLTSADFAPTQQADNTKSASVSAGSVISFTADLKGQNKEDVLYSTLLAQAVADMKHKRMDDPINWYKSYFEVLGNIGWVIQGDEFFPVEESGSTVEIQAALIKILAAIASQQVVLIVKEVLDALKNLHENDRGLVIWDRSTHSKTGGNFQLAVVTLEGTSIALNGTNVYFSAKQTDTKFLWISYSRSDISLNYNNQALTLNEDLYAKLRNKIKEKLGERSTAYVESLFP